MLIYCPTKYLYMNLKEVYRLFRLALRRYPYLKKLNKKDLLQLLSICNDYMTLRKVLSSYVLFRLEEEGIVLPVNGITTYSYKFVRGFGVNDEELEKKVDRFFILLLSELPEDFQRKYKSLLKDLLLYPVIT